MTKRELIEEGLKLRRIQLIGKDGNFIRCPVCQVVLHGGHTFETRYLVPTGEDKLYWRREQKFHGKGCTWIRSRGRV